MDVRPGGVWHSLDGVDYNNYIGVMSPERLLYSHGDGEEEPFRVTMTFDEH
ncbi:hypothetical protein [Alteribacillus bidgolensis]|uniref:hypothetical protein n=1 Tax=Alteribacillus bidgolensis TaxID=930129 RepID=UPI0026773753|nr:hypothetical protein [Alteribacillus bidgolensis]